MSIFLNKNFAQILLVNFVKCFKDTSCDFGVFRQIAQKCRLFFGFLSCGQASLFSRYAVVREVILIISQKPHIFRAYFHFLEIKCFVYPSVFICQSKDFKMPTTSILYSLSSGFILNITDNYAKIYGTSIAPTVADGAQYDLFLRNAFVHF